MADRTKISWTDATWNPVRGCSAASAGCAHCWAVRDAWRLAHHPRVRASYEGLVELTAAGRLDWTGQVRFVPELLDQPLRWRRPRRIAVCLMGDLFHPDVGFDVILRVFQVMERASWHTFQLLTKRPDRLLDFCRAFYFGSRVKWPRNVLAGVSAENQATAQARVGALLQIPAGVRFLSLEPLLAPVDCSPWLTRTFPLLTARNVRNAIGLGFVVDVSKIRERAVIPGIDWVIVGGESGPGARPCDVAWIRTIVHQCAAAAVPVFVKQLGARPVGRSLADLVGAIRLTNRKGADPSEWPSDLRIQQWPSTEVVDG